MTKTNKLDIMKKALILEIGSARIDSIPKGERMVGNL